MCAQVLPPLHPTPRGQLAQRILQDRAPYDASVAPSRLRGGHPPPPPPVQPPRGAAPLVHRPIERPEPLSSEERAARRAERERQLAEALHRKRQLGQGPGPGAHYDAHRSSSMNLGRAEPSPWARSNAAGHVSWDVHGNPIAEERTHIGDPAYYAPVNHEMAGAALKQQQYQQRAAGGNFMFESSSLQRPPPSVVHIRTEAVPNLAASYIGRPVRLELDKAP